MKYIGVCLFTMLFNISLITNLHAQVKLSQNETVAYINKIMSGSTGMNWNEIQPETIQQEFSLDRIKISKHWSLNNINSTTIRIYTKIPWEYCDEIYIKPYLDSPRFSKIEITFKVNFPVEELLDRSDDGKKDLSILGSTNSITIDILKEKAENIRKAFVHLKTLLYKKDPFE